MTTRAAIAATVHRRLRTLASDAGLKPLGVAPQTEGDYTDAVDVALRAVGAVTAAGALDVTLVTAALFDAAIAAATSEMLTQLQLYYATLTDIRVGERDEKLSQIGAALRAIAGAGAGGGSRRVIVATLQLPALPDYDLGRPSPDPDEDL